MFFKECSAMGYGKSRKDVQRHMQSPKVFKKEQSNSESLWKDKAVNLSLWRGDDTAYVRINTVNEDIINHYFALLKQTLKQNNLTNSPGQIYNVDESGVHYRDEKFLI